MAEGPVAPRGGAANDSRRHFLKGMAAGPFGLTAQTNIAAPDIWADAMTAFVRAHSHYDAFLTHVLRPACHRVDAAVAAGRDRRRALLDQGIFELEEHGNDLAALRWEALKALILTPAVDAAGLRVKMHHAQEEVFRYADPDGLFDAIGADVERLVG